MGLLGLVELSSSAEADALAEADSLEALASFDALPPKRLNRPPARAA